tara:strand:+ start:6619 stop:7899 length:1281 start_codon:yes stop_codon:yes gene_type:complete
MGFLNTANTITVTAKLTTEGRKTLLEKSNTIFSHFMLGDSDANYRTSGLLSTGMIPAQSGNLGGQNNTSNSTIKSKLYVGNTIQTLKEVEPNSSVLRVVSEELKENIVSGSSLTYKLLNKDDNNSIYSNYFKSLCLPILTTRINTFINTTSTNGGWSDTAFSGLGESNVIIGVIDIDKYGDIIDGKNVKISIPVGTGFTTDGEISATTTYDIYSTFPNTTFNSSTLDVSYIDNSTLPESLFGYGEKVSYLVCDNIQKPNNDATKSWSTGFETLKPFSLNGKELINVNTIASTGIIADKVVGVVYLDKGLFVLTEPNIVNNIGIDVIGEPETNTKNNNLGFYYYTGNTFTTSIDSIDKNMTQDILCVANRNEFFKSENETISTDDTVRISEIAITNPAGTVLAMGKFDRQVLKKKNDFVVLNVQIVV